MKFEERSNSLADTHLLNIASNSTGDPFAANSVPLLLEALSPVSDSNFAATGM